MALEYILLHWNGASQNIDTELKTTIETHILNKCQMKRFALGQFPIQAIFMDDKWVSNLSLST